MKRKVLNCIDNFNMSVKSLMTMKKPFLTLFLIYVVGIIAIIRANFYYIDDMGRARWGYAGYGYFSRYLSNFLSPIIHGDSHITDISPLTQLLAMALMAFAGIIVLYIATQRKEFKMLEIIALLPLALSPYFLECISYKFDCVYMALSVLAMIFPFLFYKRNPFVFAFISGICTIVMCTTYQASAGIFPMFAIFICMRRWLEKENYKNIIKFIFSSGFGYCSGMIIFRQFMMKDYVTYASTTLPSLNSLFKTVSNNYKTYFNFIKSDFKEEWIVLIVLISVAFVIASVCSSKQKKWIALPVSILTLIIMLMLSFGVYPVLEVPIFYPRAMYGFGAFIAFSMVQIMSTPKMYLSKMICMALCWLFFSFAFTYGNALYVQATYTDFRISEAIDDIKELEMLEEQEEIALQVNGTIGYAPTIARMPQDFQILNRLVPITFEGPVSMWGRFGIINYYGLYNIAQDPYTDLTTLDLPLVADNKYHTIYADDKHILIELK